MAGWWTVLAATGFVTLLWIAYMGMMSIRPAWVIAMWGPGVTWAQVQWICLWAIAAFKFALWLLVMGVIWLSLWARRLGKLSSGG